MNDKFKWIKEKKMSEAQHIVDAVHIKSPDGTVFVLSVSNDGVLNTKKHVHKKKL